MMSVAIRSPVPARVQAGLVLSLCCLGTHLGLAAEARIPTCEQFLEIGRNWVGIDPDRAAGLYRERPIRGLL